MEKQAAKKRRRKEEGSISMDRISELPQPILHHNILSLLSQKQSIQTCLLSKSWRLLGSTRPKLEFSVKSFPWQRREDFLYFVDKTLQRYEDQNLSIHEFLLEVPGDRSDTVPFLEKWIPIVFSLGGVKTFYLNFYSRGDSECYALPQVVYQVESIQELNLIECRLNKISSVEKVMFKNLQTLSLSEVDIEDETFEKIMSSCPLIQNLVLFLCPGLRTVKVKNAHYLKNFDCQLKATDHSIEIDAPTTLQSIRIWHCPNWYCHHPNLKSLHMYWVRLSLDIFSSNNIPCLEDLELLYCYGFEKFELSNRSIKRLIIITDRAKPLISAAIDVPNIHYFKFKSGETVPSPFSFTKPSSCEWKSDIIVMRYRNFLSTWFLELQEMLKALSQSQISLEINYIGSKNGQHIEDTYEGFNEPVVVKHLSLSGSFSSSLLHDFLNKLFSICRPRYIYHLDKMHGESLCKVLVQKRERMDCFWQQDLEDMSTEGKNVYEGEEWPSSILSKENIRLRLKWRELRSVGIGSLHEGQQEFRSLNHSKRQRG